MPDRERWKSKFGFIAASMGSAVGLGNIWLFTFRAGQNGGAAFLIPYFIFLFLAGIIGLTIEWGLGRSQDGGPIKAFESTGMPFGKYLGLIPNLTVLLIPAFYLSIIGWSLRYFVGSLTGSAVTSNPGPYFGSLANQPIAIVWAGIALFLTMGAIYFGVQKGIERANMVLLPTLFLLIIIMAIWSVSLEGAYEGIEFFMSPDMSKVMEPQTWIIALSQAFFTLSLVGGSMVIYGSYLKENDDINLSTISVAFGNTTVAIMSGFVIFPAVFAFGVDPNAGPPLVFLTLPKIFASMTGGRIFAIMFFLALSAAGISSSISMTEVNVDALMDWFGWSRERSSVVMGVVVFVLMAPATVDPSVFDLYVEIGTVWLLAIGAFLAAVAFAWYYGAERARDHINSTSYFQMGPWWEPWVKFVYPAVIVLTLMWSVEWIRKPLLQLINGGG
ncbi:MAG: NSS family neurotransmitter:Na+ symporter [Natronomonas sp.]|jgi:NSS family neurotransmitter:Na+ symporter